MSDLRTQLLAVRSEYGTLTPTNGVEAARTDPEKYNLIHAHLQWDDAIAGESYRRWQMRHLIATVVRDVRRPNGKTASIREFHAVRGESDISAYEPLDDIVQDEMMTAILLNTMKRDWQTLKRRYDQFDEFRKMILADIQAA